MQNLKIPTITILPGSYQAVNPQPRNVAIERETMMMNLNQRIPGTFWVVTKEPHWRSVEKSSTDWETTVRRKGYLVRCGLCEGVAFTKVFLDETKVSKGAIPQHCGCVEHVTPLVPARDRCRTPELHEKQRVGTAADLEAFLAAERKIRDLDKEPLTAEEQATRRKALATRPVQDYDTDDFLAGDDVLGTNLPIISVHQEGE